MIVSYNKAEIVVDENGKKFLHLELQAVFQDLKTIVVSTFAATTNFTAEELLEGAGYSMPFLTNIDQKMIKSPETNEDESSK